MTSPVTLPVALTRDRLLLDELEWCADKAGTAVHHTTAVPYARTYGRRSPLIIVGLDMANWNRLPLRPRDGGSLIAAMLSARTDRDRRLDAAGKRLRARCALHLPHARQELINLFGDTVRSAAPAGADRVPGGER
jgi:hypothetical protein